MDEDKRNGGSGRRRKRGIGELITTREAAARMRLSQSTVTTLAKRGELASVKVGTEPGRTGGRRLFPVSEVEGWLLKRLRNE